LNSTTNLTPEFLTTCVGPADEPPEYAHLFKSIFECSAAGMLVLNADGRCVSVNQAFCDLIGYTAEEVLASTMPDITHPEDVALSMQALRRLTSTEAKGFQIEKRYNHKSGRAVWVLLTVTAIPRADRLPPDLAVGVVHDISQRKAAETSSAAQRCPVSNHR